MNYMKSLVVLLAVIGFYAEPVTTICHAADVTFTTTDVKLGGSDTQAKSVQYGEAVSRGDLVYQSAGKYWRTDNDAQTSAVAAGVVLNENTTDGYGQIVVSGPIYLGSTGSAPQLIVGRNYCASSNVGKLAPDDDLATGDWITSVGHCTSAGVLWVNIKVYNAQK
jgi:hypothetical protein